jgi:hypothetical protein
MAVRCIELSATQFDKQSGAPVPLLLTACRYRPSKNNKVWAEVFRTTWHGLTKDQWYWKITKSWSDTTGLERRRRVFYQGDLIPVFHSADLTNNAVTLEHLKRFDRDDDEVKVLAVQVALTGKRDMWSKEAEVNASVWRMKK